MFIFASVRLSLVHRILICKDRNELLQEGINWVLFEYGTIVVIEGEVPSVEEAQKRATDFLKRYGPVIVGTSSAEIEVQVRIAFLL